MQYFDIYIDSMKGIYTYSDKNDEFEVGENVIVPVRNIKKSGFIIRKNLKENFNFKVLNISSKVKNSLKLSNEQIKLIEWMADYYLSSYDSIIKAMIPKKIKISYITYDKKEDNSNRYMLGIFILEKKIQDKWFEINAVTKLPKQTAITIENVNTGNRKEKLDNINVENANKYIKSIDIEVR